MQTLRKKTSPLKYKNETSRFLGEGVSFKAKLIGILEVSEARGDRMCQEALSDLKMAIRAAGEHKQRITINIAIDGLRLRDEKTGDSLYHHPVHKISFIAQDMSDSRAFGYIFGSPDTGHRFFGIKTDKAASQVVIAMRDLFQVVFALKKKEIELAKQHLDKSRYGGSPLFSSERSLLSSKQNNSQDASKTSGSDSKGASSNENRSTPAVADLVDLELELNSLQQGLTQMERITPSDPFGAKDDPFGDSFTSFPKPILPPPPSGRERANRTSESSSLFSPKTPHTAASADSSSAADLFNTTHELNTPKEFSFNEFNSSHDEPSSGDWFTPPAGNSLFEEPPLLEPTKDQQHEVAKQEIMSQFDVFTELDPLGTKTLNASIGTGKIKPYVDKKHFFQELKNPPKKVLNDLVSESQPQETSLFAATFDQSDQKNNTISKSSNSIYNNDPFGEDPFDQTDPFADSDFSRQDVFETEYNEYKLFNSQGKLNDLSIDNTVNNNSSDLSQLFGLSKSPNTSILEKQMSMASTSPRTTPFVKQNTFDSQFDYKKSLTKLYENPSLDMSSESECAPDPPPRPTNTLTHIKPPPLPPKKQATEISVKPPPRPPHTEESHYDYMEKYETGTNTSYQSTEKSPPLPVPARKSKFESDFMPEEEDYLTPVSFPTVKKDIRLITRNAGPILLPPPQKANKKSKAVIEPPVVVTVSSFFDTKPIVTTTTTTTTTTTPTLPILSLDSLDITLSQLTLSGLNELANKLSIPTSQLSNMTLVQLTNYLSNFIKNASNDSTDQTEDTENNDNFATFKADFADFNHFNNANNVSATSDSSYDRYAVFRELLQEEIKQTKIDSEPQEIVDEKEKLEEKPVENVNVPVLESIVDKYAALREIVESELKISENKISEEIDEDEDEEEDDDLEQEPNQLETIDESIVEQNSINDDKNSSIENDLNINNVNIIDDVKNDNDKLTASKENIIDYDTVLDNISEINKSPTPIKSPILKVKSPVPSAITEITQSNTRLNSGSLSDVISGSSPEVDLTGSASENAAKKTSDATGESWAIFDQPNLVQESAKDAKAVQSEEGVSPWSSDSKEFGNGSPPEWRPRVDSGSGGEHWSGGVRTGRRDQEGWWDTSAEPEVQYYPANRRSTDSYEDECYDCYDRPRRRRQTTWSGQTAGGHSSSSRDVSPWEEEPRRRDGRQSWSSRHSRQHSFDRHRGTRHTDSWDEEDDYEYEDEHTGRFHWPERHGSRESERERHPIERHPAVATRDADEWDERRMQHRRRRDMDRERWCCPDYDLGDQDKPPSRYTATRWSTTDRRKHDERYYARDQESPWEDEYGNESEEPQPHYLTARRTRIRPSSASEMDRKTGEIKSRPGQFFYGGSDGERDRRYKAGRRSKSRDSQYPESMHNRHKIDPGLTIRNPHRLKTHQHPKSQFESDFNQEMPLKKLENPKEVTIKKPLSASGRKKSKESPKTEEINTFPRKSTSRAQSLFENDFVPSESESPVSARTGQRFTFENDFETSEAESPTVSKPLKINRQKYEKKLAPSWFDVDGRRSKNNSKPLRYKQKSLFEDDFSPTDKLEAEEGITSIKEEHAGEGEDSLGSSNFESSSSRKRLSKIANRDGNIKKSESVNIFARENDPFDDDFFSTNNLNGSGDLTNVTARNSELKWTEQFSDFDIQRAK